MHSEDEMLKLVLSDKNLREKYNYNPNDYLTMKSALSAEDYPVVVAVAKIIRKLNGKQDKSAYKELYKEIYEYLNNNIIS
jgi:hypothetical protein